MANTPRPFKKQPGRVEVLYFPKRPPRRKTSAEVPHVTRTLTIPDFAVGDGERERTRTPLAGEAVEITDPGQRKRRARGTGRKQSGSHRRRSTGEITLETEAPAPKVADVLAQKNPLGVVRGLSRRQLTELSVEGHGLFEAGNLESARRVFELLVALEPSEAFPYTMLGTIFLALGQQDRALALFEAALGVDRRDLSARVYRGELRLHRGRYKLAIDDLQKALEDGDPRDPFVDRARRLMKIARRAQVAEQAGKRRK